MTPAPIDLDLCTFCEDPLDDGRPWRRAAPDGLGAHDDCLRQEGLL